MSRRLTAKAGRIAAAVAITALGAAVATFLLRPRGGLIEPASVDLAGYFSAAEIQRAEAFRGPQRVIALAGTVVSATTLALLALRPPRTVRRALEASARRPLVGGAAVGAGLSLVLVLVNLPLDAIGHQRSVEVGLSTQGFGAWLLDVGKAAGIGAVLTGGGGVLAVALVRRFPRSWWAPGAAGVLAIGVVLLGVGPVVLDPVFNRFTPLPPGELRTEVLDLAGRSGVRVGEVYRVDASRRTTGANAYVGGLGPTKRVVLYDNLLEGFPPAQVRSVVAHELSHQRHRDLGRGLLWLVIVAPAAMLLVQRLTEAFRGSGGAFRGGGVERLGPLSRSAPRRSRRAATPELLPALGLALALVSFGVGAASNVLSRQVEARADAFALELTRDPAAFVGLERGLALRNVSDPDPPWPYQMLFGTHPPTVVRIGYGVAFEARTGM